MKLTREPQRSCSVSPSSPASGEDSFDGFHTGDRFQTSAPTTSVWTSSPLQARPEFAAAAVSPSLGSASCLAFDSASCFALSSTSEGGM